MKKNIPSPNIHYKLQHCAKPTTGVFVGFLMKMFKYIKINISRFKENLLHKMYIITAAVV